MDMATITANQFQPTSGSRTPQKTSLISSPTGSTMPPPLQPSSPTKAHPLTAIAMWPTTAPTRTRTPSTTAHPMWRTITITYLRPTKALLQTSSWCSTRTTITRSTTLPTTGLLTCTVTSVIITRLCRCKLTTSNTISICSIQWITTFWVEISTGSNITTSVLIRAGG